MCAFALNGLAYGSRFRQFRHSLPCRSNSRKKGAKPGEIRRYYFMPVITLPSGALVPGVRKRHTVNHSGAGVGGGGESWH